MRLLQGRNNRELLKYAVIGVMLLVLASAAGILPFASTGVSGLTTQLKVDGFQSVSLSVEPVKNPITNKYESGYSVSGVITSQNPDTIDAGNAVGVPDFSVTFGLKNYACRWPVSMATNDPYYDWYFLERSWGPWVWNLPSKSELIQKCIDNIWSNEKWGEASNANIWSGTTHSVVSSSAIEHTIDPNAIYAIGWYGGLDYYVGCAWGVPRGITGVMGTSPQSVADIDIALYADGKPTVTKTVAVTGSATSVTSLTYGDKQVGTFRVPEDPGTSGCSAPVQSIRVLETGTSGNQKTWKAVPLELYTKYTSELDDLNFWLDKCSDERPNDYPDGRSYSSKQECGRAVINGLGVSVNNLEKGDDVRILSYFGGSGSVGAKGTSAGSFIYYYPNNKLPGSFPVLLKLYQSWVGIDRRGGTPDITCYDARVGEGREYVGSVKIVNTDTSPGSFGIELNCPGMASQTVSSGSGSLVEAGGSRTLPVSFSVDAATAEDIVSCTVVVTGGTGKEDECEMKITGVNWDPCDEGNYKCSTDGRKVLRCDNMGDYEDSQVCGEDEKCDRGSDGSFTCVARDPGTNPTSSCAEWNFLGTIASIIGFGCDLTGILLTIFVIIIIVVILLKIIS